MKATLIYTGDDGESHLRDLDIPLVDSPYGAISHWVPITGVAFRQNPDDGLTLDFHVAPRRQFVITLEGAVEIDCGNGERRRIGAGDIIVAADTTGKGHISRDVESPRRSIFLPLTDDVDPLEWAV
jgi:hypothetical protein